MARRRNGAKRLKETRDQAAVYVERMIERPVWRRAGTSSYAASR